MKNKIILTSALIISGCAPVINYSDIIEPDSGEVKIYSARNFSMAQIKADLLCKKHAFYIKKYAEYNYDMYNRYPDFQRSYDYYPFLCEVQQAAEAGNQEAIAINEKELKEDYDRLEKAKQHQYEVHKAYAKKHGGDSYSVVNPDGSIEAHYIDGNGNACHSNASQYGGETYCD